MVSAPPSPSRRIDSSDRSVIFTGVPSVYRASPGRGRDALAEPEVQGARRWSAPSRLLLGEAVQRAEPPDEVDGVDPDDLPRREELGERVQRHPVVAVVERRDDDDIIG